LLHKGPMGAIFEKKTLPALLLALVLAGQPGLLPAAVVEGVELPDTVQLGASRLRLNGAGVREKFFFDIYVAGLYLKRPQHDAAHILAQDGPWRMVMHFLYRKVGKNKLDEGWEEGFRANLKSAERKRLRPAIDRFKAFFPDLRRDDEVWLDHLPGKGVTVTLNGQILGRVEGEGFAVALLRIWLGEEPVTRSLKEALLRGLP